MAVTIRDVAMRAGVAVSTASRALNDRAEVSGTVRERVLAAARALDYTANLHARGLRGGTTRTIGVVLLTTDAFSFNAPLMSGIYDVATPCGYSVTVCDARGHVDGERAAHVALREKRVEGLLLNAVDAGPTEVGSLIAAGLPVVLLNRQLAGVACDQVRLDYPEGTRLATAHLLARGHRRILCPVGMRNHMPTMERLRGYRAALAAAGVPYDDTLVLHADGLEATYDAVRAALRGLSPRPTAIMAYNDEHAMPVLSAVTDLGLRVPDDIALVGQNDLPLARYLNPPLTTVAHRVREMARLATGLLLWRIGVLDHAPIADPRDVAGGDSAGFDSIGTDGGDAHYRHLALAPRLVVRGSCGHAMASTLDASRMIGR